MDVGAWRGEADLDAVMGRAARGVAHATERPRPLREEAKKIRDGFAVEIRFTVKK